MNWLSEMFGVLIFRPMVERAEACELRRRYGEIGAAELMKHG